MNPFKNVWFWFGVFLVILFILTYVGLSYGVDWLMGDKIYGQEFTINAVVDGLQIEEAPYTADAPLQPAYNITKL